MNKKMGEVNLIDLIPPNLKKDPDIIAASEAVDQEYKKVIDQIDNCLTIVGIDNAKEEVVDHIAIGANHYFYDQNLPLEIKRKLAKKAYIFHFTKGTPYAVEQLITDVFDEATVEEWFEYGGDPYYFRLQIIDRITDGKKLEQLIKAINSVKNKRSKLEVININRKNKANLFVGTFVHSNKNITIKQDRTVYDQNIMNDLKIGIANRQNNYIQIFTEV